MTMKLESANKLESESPVEDTGMAGKDIRYPAAVSLKDSAPGRCLSDSVREAMEKYFNDLEGHEPKDLYNLFLAQVEKPLFEKVMHHTGGNVSRAAQVLGLNRATLRNRLKKYNIG